MGPPRGNWNSWGMEQVTDLVLREKCPNTEFFPVRIFPVFRLNTAIYRVKRFVLYPEHLGFIKTTARFLKVPIETRSTVYSLISAEIQINTTLDKNRTFSH